MKDITGREINVGDKVAYASEYGGSASMTVGVVTKAGQGSVTVARTIAKGVVNGTMWRWVWDRETKTGTDVMVKAKLVVVHFEDRIVVLEAAVHE